MTFVGRKTELTYLNQYFNNENSNILVVYGQKGVGKTSLLHEFCSDKSFSYYSARSCSDREQRFWWARELQTNQAATFDEEFPEYEELFTSITAKLPGNQKSVLIIDEFQNLIKGDSSFFSRINQFTHATKENLLVILCSSASGWVENHFVGKIGSDAMAISGFLKVKELDASIIHELYSSFSEDDIVQLYAILGGVPGLWDCLDSTISAKENIIRYIISPNSAIHSVMTGCLLEDLRETAVYNTILATMAGENDKLNDIYHHTGFSRAKISVYLKNLMEIDLVEKIGAGVYRITRPYIRFYFCFIFPNQSLLEQVTPLQFYKEVVEESFPGFVRKAFRKS